MYYRNWITIYTRVLCAATIFTAPALDAFQAENPEQSSARVFAVVVDPDTKAPRVLSIEKQARPVPTVVSSIATTYTAEGQDKGLVGTLSCSQNGRLLAWLRTSAPTGDGNRGRTVVWKVNATGEYTRISMDQPASSLRVITDNLLVIRSYLDERKKISKFIYVSENNELTETIFENWFDAIQLDDAVMVASETTIGEFRSDHANKLYNTRPNPHSRTLSLSRLSDSVACLSFEGEDGAWTNEIFNRRWLRLPCSSWPLTASRDGSIVVCRSMQDSGVVFVNVDWKLARVAVGSSISPPKNCRIVNGTSTSGLLRFGVSDDLVRKKDSWIFATVDFESKTITHITGALYTYDMSLIIYSNQ